MRRKRSEIKGSGARKATLKEVAAEAGVSIATVSYVLNNTRPIGEGTKQRVLETVRKLGYEPNKSARAMRTGRSGDIGLIVPDITNPYFSALAESVTKAASKNGRSVYLLSSNGMEKNERAAIESLAHGGVDGVIWFPNYDEDTYADADIDLPIVVIDRNLPAYDLVHAEYKTGGRLAAKYLISKGHKRVGLIEGPQNISSSRQRSEGFVEAIAEGAKLTWRVENPFSFEISEPAVTLIKKRNVSAIMCGSDAIAVGLLQFLREARIACPDEIAVVGYNDVSMASLVHPALTSIKMPIAEMGSEAVELLLRRIENFSSSRRRTVLGVSLTERDSA